MKKRDFYLLNLYDLKTKSRRYLQDVARERILTRQQIRADLDHIIATFPSRAHKFMKAELRAYQTGYLTAIEDSHTRFLYLYKNKFYAPRESVDTGFTPWDKIPHEDWENLADYGGVYWIGNKQPTPYDVPEVL
jgi:hypothetical protein